MAIDVSRNSLTMTHDLHMKLLYLENRVAFVRLLLPSEAKLAMDIANGSSGNLREVDLNEKPMAQNQKILSRIEALSKTVETGRRYFPHCLQVLDKFMEDDLPDESYCLEKGSTEEQKIKRMRFMELKEDVQKAFTEDKAELHRIGLSSSSSSSSL